MNITELLFYSFFHLLSAFVRSFPAVYIVQTQIILQNNQNTNIPAVFLHYLRKFSSFKPLCICYLAFQISWEAAAGG